VLQENIRLTHGEELQTTLLTVAFALLNVFDRECCSN
jgi:hypothetical protein